MRNTNHNHNHNRIIISEKPLFFTILIVVIITGGLTITTLHRTGIKTPTSILCTFVNSQSQTTLHHPTTTPTTLISAILHYATTHTTAQQTLPEIKLTVNTLQTLAPCNLLVFGIGHESIIWSSLNSRGTTLFLEDDLNSVHKTLNDAPSLRVHHISYNTQLSDADYLLTSYKTSPKCLPPQVYLRGNTRCKLALSSLPEEVYKREWDVIIIDGPKGYYGEAPGRMAAIFSAAVMARGRRRAGDTHVFVHDVNRKVEKEYAEEFLCKNYLVSSENRLWHFKIPPAPKDSPTFC